MRYFNLPKATPFEAQAQERRRILLLFGLLLASWVLYCSSCAFILVSLLMIGQIGRPWHQHLSPGEMFWIGVSASLLLGSVLAFWITAVRWIRAYATPLEASLEMLGARPADPEDDYHRRFIHLVEDIRFALGGRALKAVVIPSTGCNAFSLEDSQGHAAIGVTEGLLSRVGRLELTGVVAHEASHLVRKDSWVATLACLLTPPYESVREMVDTSSPFNGYNRLRFFLNPYSWPMLLSWFMGRVVTLSLSREREVLADALAVQMTKNPLALLHAFKSLEGRYRGGLDIPGQFEALFFLSPNLEDERRSWTDRLFSNHPPMDLRVRNLMRWAHMDLRASVAARTKRSLRAKADPLLAAVTSRKFYYHDGETWAGPATFPQMMRQKGFGPRAWVCEEGSEVVLPASDLSEWKLLHGGGANTGLCPRCGVPLRRERILGATARTCPLCDGKLMDITVLKRLALRAEDDDPSLPLRKKYGNEKSTDSTPSFSCPACGRKMDKFFYLGCVPLDRCPNEPCGMIWLDGKELEEIQAIFKRSFP